MTALHYTGTTHSLNAGQCTYSGQLFLSGQNSEYSGRKMKFFIDSVEKQKRLMCVAVHCNDPKVVGIFTSVDASGLERC